MSKQKAIAVFDVGKTNKKLFLFDEDYKIAFEESAKFEEIQDEDGFPTENLQELTDWVKEKFDFAANQHDYELTAVNFSAYGASFVHIDENDQPITPLYNYLKPYPGKLKKQFYATYGGESLISQQTASPVLGNLNSGMQLYRLKYERPEVFSRIKYSLHLPQYLSFILTSQKTADITSIGCHTQLWDFRNNDYHAWVYAEQLSQKFPALCDASLVHYIEAGKKNISTGIGLHDSSAALIPYMKFFPEPFVLLSTGTWCISLNPFNHSPLSDEELHHDCLCYMSYKGLPVKASRLFAGQEHEEEIKKLASYFDKNEDYYKSVLFNPVFLKHLDQTGVSQSQHNNHGMLHKSVFTKRAINDFGTYEEAYHYLIYDIMQQQVYSTKLVLSGTPVKRILVDGGFGKNDVYMNLLAVSFPGMKISAASIAQASSLGAAMVLHNHFSGKEIPANVIQLKDFNQP
ncbi:MAG TPA: FGGY family carbohydrate kinase [Puia sp.]|nr:FGGY family carbohydrate kinase [Puia sp.]